MPEHTPRESHASGALSVKRQADLGAAYEERKDSDAPYAGVNIQNLGELQWILLQRQWSGAEWKWGGSINPRANLRGAILCGANLHDAELCGANLEGANFRAVNLSGAFLHGANLSHANLTLAYLLGTDLRRAKLSWADLTAANLTGATLDGADLRATILAGTTLTVTTLRDIQGIPQWPTLPPADLVALYEEATDPMTSSARLQALTWQWPGILCEECIAANPNTPSVTLRHLARRVPLAFLRNPLLPLLFLEDPDWLSPYAAQGILQALTDNQVPLSPADTAIVHLMEQCAHVKK